MCDRTALLNADNLKTENKNTSLCFLKGICCQKAVSRLRQYEKEEETAVVFLIF